MHKNKQENWTFSQKYFIERKYLFPLAYVGSMVKESDQHSVDSHGPNRLGMMADLAIIACSSYNSHF